MSAQHTQGRLHVAGQDKVQIRSDKHQIAKAWSFAGKTGQENARRLAACWNAFEGIPTEDIEGKTIAEYVSQQAFITGMTPSQEGMDLGVKGLAAQMMAASFAGQFIGNGAVNYLEMSMLHPDIGPFTVTIQRTQGLTPAQKLFHAEAQRDELLKALKAVMAQTNSEEMAAAFDMARAAIDKIEGGAV